MNYLDLSDYKLSSILFLDGKLSISFQSHDKSKSDVSIHLLNTVAFRDWIGNHSLASLRIDDAGSFGFDVSLHLQRPEVKSFMELFVFSDSQKPEILFRAIAEQITVKQTGPNKDSLWPF